MWNQFNHSNETASNSSDLIHHPTTGLTIFVAIAMTVLGFLGTLGSALVIVVIFTSRALRSPCFQLIAAGSCGSLLSALYYLARGINQLLIIGEVISPARINWLCILPAVLLGLWGPPFHSLVSCAIACDRVASLLAPIRYRQFNRRYAACTVLLCAFLVTVQDAIGFALSPWNKVVSCREFSDSLDRNFKLAFAGLLLAYFTLTVLLYLIMLGCFHFRRRICRNNGSERENDTLYRQQAAVMPAIKLMMVLYLLTGVLGEVLINIARSMEPSVVALPVRGFGSILKAMASLVEVFSLIARSSKFRKCCMTLLGCKSRAVAQATSSMGTDHQTQETRK